MKRTRKFTVVIERNEDGYYVAPVPGLRGCHTQAKNLDTLMKRTREVIELCLSVLCDVQLTVDELPKHS